MNLRTYNLNKEQSLILAVVIIIFTAAIVYIPMKTLLAEYYYNKVDYVMPISEGSIDDYKKNINRLEKASAILPAETIYLKALADLYARLGKWREVMDVLDKESQVNTVNTKDDENNAHSPGHSPARGEGAKFIPPPLTGGGQGEGELWRFSGNSYAKAIACLTKAISVEPTNPDYHLALGQLYDAIKNTADADKEFRRAIKAYPINAPLRYELAVHCLNTGRKGDALEHARILAGIDTSYVLPDTAKNRQMAERNMPLYTSALYNSYLFKALEIAWRVSRDIEAVKGIAPDNPYADEVVRLFMESKGIED